MESQSTKIPKEINEKDLTIRMQQEKIKDLEKNKSILEARVNEL